MQNKKYKNRIAGLLICSAVLFFSSCKKNNAQVSSCERIVCLNPAGAEILYAIGAENRIAARTDFCDYPEAILNLPSVGGFDGASLSPETILSYKPDFVYASKGMHDLLSAQLEMSGVKVYLSETSDIQSIFDEILYIGSITGCREKAEETVNNLKLQLEEISAEFSGKKVFFELWHNPFSSAGNSSFINDVIEKAGGKNICSEIAMDYPVVSEEFIIAANPDVILVPSMNNISAEDVSKRSGWQNIPAVKNKKIILINADLFSRPGPRIVQAVLQLSEYLK